MEIIGIIAEYNPFHNGHKYHINKIRELYKDCLIIAVVSSSFTQRGEISVLNKWEKTNIALSNGVDLVIELPFVFSSQSADIFAHGSLKILNELKVNKIIFGSESNDIEKLKNIANIQINNKEFDYKVKEYLKQGNNYPTSISKALKNFNINKIESPNDLLGISYIKEIIKNNYKIEAITIKRTNNYHGNNTGNIISAKEIREKIKNNYDIENYINYNQNLIYKNTNYIKFLKYQIINNINNLSDYQTVDEGIENRLKKYIYKANTIEELTKLIKTKRYTYNKINRMFIHILINFTKKENKSKLDYIRVLGFNENGRKYLNKLKNNTSIPIITKYKDIKSPILDIEKRATYIYSLITSDTNQIKREFERPIYKKQS